MLLPLLLSFAMGPRMSTDLRIDREWDGTPAHAGESVLVRLVDGGDTLDVHVDAPYYGDPPPDAPVGPLWGLWDHEVVELFVVGVGQPEPYLEVEVGPHGHHLVILLDGARTAITARMLPLDFEAEIRGDRWVGIARIPRDYIPFGAFRANAYSIHGVGDQRRYLASSPVPGDGPDFHRIAFFPEVQIP